MLLSPLKGVDGKIYALAQGNIFVGGFAAASDDGNSVSVNVPTVGRVPNGANVERPAPTQFGYADHIILNLHKTDFTTATRMADAINEAFGALSARPLDGTSVQVLAPADPGQRVSFVSLVENVLWSLGKALPRWWSILDRHGGDWTPGARGHRSRHSRQSHRHHQ